MVSFDQEPFLSSKESFLAAGLFESFRFGHESLSIFVRLAHKNTKCSRPRLAVNKSTCCGFRISPTSQAVGSFASAKEKGTFAGALFLNRGGGEIRTHGAFRHSCFQDRCTKPLCDASIYSFFEHSDYITLFHDFFQSYAKLCV